MTAQHTLKTGDLAYLDSFAGFIPCKVLSVTKSDSGTVATVKLTASRGAYSRGEVFTSRTTWIIPRQAVYTRSGQFRIRAYLAIPDDEIRS